jgi:hypothetical protein
VYGIAAALLAVYHRSIFCKELALIITEILLTNCTHVPRLDEFCLHPLLGCIRSGRFFALDARQLISPTQNLVDFVVEQRTLPQKRVLRRNT